MKNALLAKYEIILHWLAMTAYLAAPLALFATLAALCSGTAVRMLPASFNSLWVLPHVFFTKLAVGAFCIAIVLIVACLLKGRRSQARFMATLPAAELLDDYIYKITAFAFCCWTLTIVTGALWAHESWERYWGWDPIETWSLITWLLLGVYLHLRRFFGWRGKRGIAVLIICIAVSLLTVFSLPFLADSLHGDYYR